MVSSQTPETHFGFWKPFVPQLLPHAPQLLKLSAISVHCPLQSTKPGRQAHVPAEQNSRLLQKFPHCPHACGSCIVSAQIWPLLVVQVDPAQAHWVLAHVSPSRHCLLHEPHACGSVAVFTQAPWQTWLPTGQVHCPETHAWPAAQLWPHWPQLSGLAERSTQPANPQATCPATGQMHCPETHDWPEPQDFPHEPQ